MLTKNIPNQLFTDSYIDLSYNRYLAFKATNESYQESYKEEILSKLNTFIQNQEINEFTVLDIVQKLKDENPTSGSFVHWSNTDNLVRYTSERPAEVAALLDDLYHSTAPMEERIEGFRNSGKAFDPGISLGAPLFGYLLAAYDFKAYPLYKQEVYVALKKSFGIEHKLAGVGANYQAYFELCQGTLNHLEKGGVSVTMLDVQDFFYCSTQYDPIKVEAAVDYLYEVGRELHSYKANPQLLLDSLAQLDEEQLHSLEKQYENKEKVNLIKFKIIEQILRNGRSTIDELEEIKEQVKVKYETNILNSWNNFTILFQLYYFHKKGKVQEEQRKIHEAIRNLPEYADLNLVEGKVLNGFNWNQNFGGSRCWLAAYEEGNLSHKTAPQLFVGVDETGVEYGLHFGSEHSKGGQRDYELQSDVTLFSYEDFRRKLARVADKFKHPELQDDHADALEVSDDQLSRGQWEELLQNDAVFTDKDLVYIYKMYDLGGEATATQLASVSDAHPSSFNAPVANLARRVLEKTGMEPPKREDGTDCYWCVLFDGEYETNDHFRWKLKGNLKEAISLVYESHTYELEAYSKDDFLGEVFLNENQYDTMASLLSYKKNIILQGPPGVGKTYVSKRLAYSLMGVKDPTRVELVQFHQNYSYEDFVMGFRPDKQGFSLQFGIFYDFCQRAIENPGQDYYFIIDEINRGNLSKIFGELFMLIEKDKRDEFVTMGYSKKKFTVPANVHLIGTMNTADRSLAQLEVALRRRFAFMTLEPEFHDKWAATVMREGVSSAMVERIVQTVSTINETIVSDFQLGKGYVIGHSFFTGKPEALDEEIWYQNIIRFEIRPLLEEYFFDRPEMVKSLLEGSFNEI